MEDVFKNVIHKYANVHKQVKPSVAQLLSLDVIVQAF